MNGAARRMSEPELDVIAEFNDATSLILVLRAAKDKRNISFATLDHLADLAEYASSKLLGPTPQRVIGQLSFCKHGR